MTIEPPSNRDTATGKLECFEVIRGLAALAVVVGHFILGFCPALMFRNGPRWEALPNGLQALARFPGKFIWRGELPVAIFFVLSGFVLSLAFFQKGSVAALGSAAIRRFPRLMLPVAASVLFAYLLLRCGAMVNQETVRQLDDLQGLARDPLAVNDASNNWLRSYYGFAPSLASALREGTWGTFHKPTPYNQVLWTMPYELVGSFLVYGFLALFGGMRNRWLLYGAVGAVLAEAGHYQMIDFLLGIGLADVWVLNQKTGRKALPLFPALALVALAIFVIPWMPLSAFLVIAATAASPRLQEILGGRWLTFLGRISFPMYLLHMPIFCSLGCALYLLLSASCGWTYAMAATTAAVLCFAVTLAVSWLFYLFVDQPTLQLLRWLDNTLFRPLTNANTVCERTTSLPLSKSA